MTLYKIFTPIILLGTICAFNSQAYGSTLEIAVEAACEYHPDVFTAQLDVRQAHEGVKQARATILPRISSISEVGFADDAGAGAAIQSSVANSRSRSTQLSLDQAIYIGGRGKAAIRGAQFQRDTQWYTAERQILNVQLTAIQAYITLVQAQAILEVREEQLQSLRTRRNEAQRRFELGGGTKSDIVQAEARIARNEADIISAQNDIIEARASLEEASGLLLNSKIDAELSLPKIPINLEAALEKALKFNPDVKAANASIDVADETLKTTQGDRSPELRLLGDLNVQRDTAFNGFEREDASLRLRLTVPIFSGGALASRERGANFAKSSAKFNYNRVVNRVREAVTTSWSQYVTSQRLIGVNNALVIAAEKAAEAVKKEADAGFRANQDVLDTQQELLDAKLALTNARYNYILSAYFLLESIGDLDNEAYPKCQDLLPDFNQPSKRKIIRKINNFVPGVDIKIPERKRDVGPRNRR